MKKKLFLGCAVFCASILLCGFDSSESASDVLEKSAQSSSSAASISADMDMNCDISISLNDGEISTAFPVKLSLDSDIETILNPFSLGMDGEMEMTILTSSSSEIQLYCVTDGDTSTDLYFRYSDNTDDEGDNSWTHVNAGGMNLTNLLTSISTADFSALERLGFDFALSSDAKEFQGRDCYLIYNDTDSSSSSALSDAISEFFSDDAIGMLTGELSSFLGYDLSSDQLVNLFDGLRFNISYYVDCETYLPLGLHIDLNGSDLPNLDTFVESALKGLLSTFQSEGVEDNTAVDIVINDLSMDYSLSYDDVDSVTVPDAALATPALSE